MQGRKSVLGSFWAVTNWLNALTSTLQPVTKAPATQEEEEENKEFKEVLEEEEEDTNKGFQRITLKAIDLKAI